MVTLPTAAFKQIQNGTFAKETKRHKSRTASTYQEDGWPELAMPWIMAFGA